MAKKRSISQLLRARSTRTLSSNTNYGNISNEAKTSWTPEYRAAYDRKGGDLGFAQREFDRGYRQGGRVSGEARVNRAFGKSGRPTGAVGLAPSPGVKAPGQSIRKAMSETVRIRNRPQRVRRRPGELVG